jgi:exodeoxyribonuclease-5
MRWSPKQDQALRAVDAWLSDPNVFRLFGYAGTGKTTLARHFAESVSGLVLFGAFTGKATHVLRQKGCPNAATIHSMIYITREKSAERLKELEQRLAELIQKKARAHLSPSETKQLADLKEEVQRERENCSRPSFRLNAESIVKEASLTVIDEVSMVDGRMGEDLLSFGTRVLVLGDPAQLPPVGGGGFFTETQSDIMLDEIHRQAENDPIIHMATRVRQGLALELGSYGDSAVIGIRDERTATAMDHDQMLVGRNATRHAWNDRARERLGFGGKHPLAGERLVCLRNNHELELFNGSTWNVLDSHEPSDDFIDLVVRSDDDEAAEPKSVTAHLHHFERREGHLPPWMRMDAEEFDYGYALTTHKAQGSQWDSVFVRDESSAFRQDGRRWLYTAITRAAKRVTVLR